MQPENSFDKLSKRLAVAVSRRSLLRSLSLAAAGALLPWSQVFAQIKQLTSLDLETRFFAPPRILDLRTPGGIEQRCKVPVTIKATGKLALGHCRASKDSECPTDIASYFENTDLPPEIARKSTFDTSKVYDVRVVDGRSRIIKTYPVATFYSFLNPSTGEQELEAYCTMFTHLDPRVHNAEPDLKLIHYKRMQAPEKLTSLDDDVTCGDINYAYENEIKTRKPIALRDFTVDAVPHQASANRVNATSASTSNHSGHKSK